VLAVEMSGLRRGREAALAACSAAPHAPQKRLGPGSRGRSSVVVAATAIAA
jgi:hypothetical protein